MPSQTYAFLAFATEANGFESLQLDSSLSTDPVTPGDSECVSGDVQSVLHPQMHHTEDARVPVNLGLPLTSESISCNPEAGWLVPPYLSNPLDRGSPMPNPPLFCQFVGLFITKEIHGGRHPLHRE